MRLIFIAILFSSFMAEARISFIQADDLATWEKLLKIAESGKLNLLIYLNDVPANCIECAQLEKETFRKKSLSRYINEKYIPVKITKNSTLYTSFRKYYPEIGDLPEIMIFSPKEQLFYRNKGFVDDETLMKHLKDVENSILNYPEWQRKAAENTLSKDEWVNFLLIEHLNLRVTPSSSIIRSFSLQLDSSDYQNPLVLRYAFKLGIDVDFPVYQTLVAHNDWINDSLNFNWEAYFARVYNYNIRRAIMAKDSVLLEDMIVQLHKLESKSEMPNLALKSRQFFLAELKRWKAYDTLTVTYLRTLPADSANSWQREAMFLMENYSDDDPMALAAKYLRLGLAQKETFELYYTLSLYLFQNGAYVNAHKAAFLSSRFATTSEQRELASKMMALIEFYY